MVFPCLKKYNTFAGVFREWTLAMEQTYLAALIQTLNQEEQIALGVFLQSTYANGGINRERICLLYNQMIAPGQDSLKKEALFSLVFPDTPQVTGKLDKLMSELSALIRQFLLTRHYLGEEKKFTQSLDWAIILRERGLHNRYSQNFSKAENFLQQEKQESLGFYFNQFQLAYERYHVESMYNRIKGDLYIPEAIASLDTYYLATRLELQNLLLLQQKLTRVELPDHLSLDYPKFITHETWGNSIFIMVATKINEQLLVETPTVDAFNEIMDLLKTYDQHIAEVPLQNFYAYLRNLCILMIQEGKSSFTSVLHDIQRDNLQRGYLLLQGKLAPSAYLSVARIAIRIGKSEWALDFTESYKELLLSEEDSENYYLFNKAECLFSMGRFEEALELLPQNFTDLIYLTNSKRLEIKLYYEMESDLLNYKIDALKMFISRASKKMITDYVREMEGNFVNILLQIVQCPPRNPDKVERIIRRIQDKKIIGDREWLLEKAQQLL